MGGSYQRSGHLLPASILLVGLLLLAGCATPMKVTRGAMVGTYEARYDGYYGVNLGKEILVLRIDGTYEQTYVPTSGKGWKHTGQWTLDTSQGSSRVRLYDYWEAADYGAPKVLVPPGRAGTEDLPVEERAGTICITVNSDLDQYYARTN